MGEKLPSISEMGTSRLLEGHRQVDWGGQGDSEDRPRNWQWHAFPITTKKLCAFGNAYEQSTRCRHPEHDLTLSVLYA